MTTIDDALTSLTDSIIDIPGVTGTAIGECDGDPCLSVLLVTKTDSVMNQIPATWQGFIVKIEETGAIETQGTP